MGNFVRISKYAILSCLLTLLSGQVPKSVQFSHLDSIAIHDSLSVLLQDDHSSHYEYQLTSFDYTDSIKAHYELFPIKRVIHNIYFDQDIEINQKVLNQMFSRMLTSKTDIKSSLELIKNSYPFIGNTPAYEWGIQNEKESIIIHFDPSFKQQFSAIIGANKSYNNMWEATGEIDLNIENIFKNAESINFYWKKLDTLTQEIQFQFQQPHSFGTPIGLNISLDRNTHDGYFTESQSHISISTPFKYMALLSLGYESSHIHATNTGKDVGYLSNDAQSIVGGIKSNSLNNRWLPTQGHSFTISGKIGQIQQELMYNLMIMGVRIFPIKKYWFGHIGFWGEQIKSGKNNLPKSRLIRFGGMETMKGYRENEFMAEWVISPEFQLSYILNDGMHFSSFYQIGRFESNQSILHSIGFGLKQVKESSIIEILYGVPMRDPITNGQLHFKFISRF